MKPVRIYCINSGDDPYSLSGSDDVFAVGEWELALAGSSAEKLETETSGRGRWLVLELKPATARLDREAKQMTLVGDAVTGFRNDNLLLPSANFAAFVGGWKWESDGAPALKTPNAEVFEDLHPNVSDRIRMTLERHIRPNISQQPGFFTQSSVPSTASSGTSPQGSEPTTSTQVSVSS